MPEYSSTTITPSDGVQVPGMNGSTSGNFLLSALKSYILSEKGLANGLASLDGNGKLTAAQLPDLADDVIVVDSYSTLPAIGTASKIYITADNNKGYRWDPELTTPDYVKIFELDKSIVFGYYSSGSFYEDSEHTVQITPVEHVFYVDVSLADIYVLNDGTLIELLGTKWAKITDIQDGTITAGLATKAFQDAMGRAIITTYETKADASDLKSAIDANSKRITNLETKAGDEIVVDYPSSTYGMDEVPASVAQYAKVTKLRGVSRVENQCIHDITSALQTANATVNSFADGVTTFTATAKRGGVFSSRNFNPLPQKDGHYVLIFMDVKATTPTTEVRLYCYGGYAYKPIVASSNWQQVAVVVQVLASWGYDFNYQNYMTLEDTRDANWDAIQTRNWKCRDLTEYFGTTDLSFLGSTKDEKLATIQRDYPELLIPSDYDAGSLVSTTYSAIESDPAGKNFMDISQYGLYELVAGTSRYGLKRKLPAGTYTISGKASSGQTYTVGTIVNDTFTSTVNVVDTFSQTMTLSAEGYIAIWINNNVATLDWVMLNSGSSALPWEAYMTDTLTLPESVTLRSAGSVADEVELNVEVEGVAKKRQTERVNRVDLGSLTWNYEDDTQRFYAILSDAKKASATGNTVLIGAIQPLPYKRLFTDSEHDYVYMIANIANEDDAFWFYTNISNQTSIQIKDTTYNSVGSASDPSSFLGHLQGKYLNYELATESVTLSDPISDPFLEVEGGGTIRPIQTQTTEIDSAMTAEYLAV